MSPSQTEPTTILIVEDNEEMNIALREILESYGYNALSTTDGKQALKLLQETIPDVVLCDIMMPVMDGYTLLEKMRADQHLRTLPFIFLTARGSTEDQRHAKEIGIEDYLIKPIDEEYVVVALRNVLRRQQLMRDTMQEEIDLLRHQIIRILQHEFRTPLTFVLGYSEYLLQYTEDDNLDIEELRSSARAILEGGQRLQSLIESFLLLAELQNRRVEQGDMEVLKPHTLLVTVARDFQNQASENNLTITVLPANTELTAIGDAELLNEALRRLLDNSIRYRRAESQTIWLSIERLSTFVGIRVRDEGRGIPQDEQVRISKPFQQVDRDNRTQPGAGLSLAMIHHIVRLHNGKLEIESEEGAGSTFTLWLPASMNEQERRDLLEQM